MWGKLDSYLQSTKRIDNKTNHNDRYHKFWKINSYGHVFLSIIKLHFKKPFVRFVLVIFHKTHELNTNKATHLTNKTTV